MLGRPAAVNAAAADGAVVRTGGFSVCRVEIVAAAFGGMDVHMNFIPDCPINIVQINFQKAARFRAGKFLQLRKPAAVGEFRYGIGVGFQRIVDVAHRVVEIRPQHAVGGFPFG